MIHWSEDVELLADWLKSRSPDVPLVLHGLEIGALLAGNAFHNGIGSGAFTVVSTCYRNQALRSTLLRWVGLEHLFKPSEDVKPAAEYIRQLEQGALVEVEGYQWSSSLWRDSFGVKLPGLDDR